MKKKVDDFWKFILALIVICVVTVALLLFVNNTAEIQSYDYQSLSNLALKCPSSETAIRRYLDDGKITYKEYDLIFSACRDKRKSEIIQRFKSYD